MTKNLPTSEELARAAALLREGKLVAFPTETVYGLGGNALDASAVARIYEAKGRPSTSPLIVHVDGIDMARRVVASWPAVAQALAERFWPGPLTLVLPKRPEVPDSVTAGLPTVGIRVPAHPLALELIRAAGVPVAAPSANRFTQLSPTTAEHVRQALGDRVDLILDGGPCAVGIESTVISLAGDVPVLLRPGMLDAATLEPITGKLAAASSGGGGEPQASPGMHPVHYAPRTPLRIGVPFEGRRSGYLFRERLHPAFETLEMPQDPNDYGAVLYAALHRMDTLGLQEIVVEAVPEDPRWDAIRDRLARAAATIQDDAG